ncbi:hypothetical protein GQ55_1G338300 [Panicum hallii var. hallii]|uniref:Uncharacterized protein n=1 Tax=Panicum hallii var. hallii TaxID=1504633 RepID=A0A2T7FAC3_9POAL|nr:hypothetical protein GQ55_1G338300 [Panicum hallii var. hallii]
MHAHPPHALAAPSMQLAVMGKDRDSEESSSSSRRTTAHGGGWMDPPEHTSLAAAANHVPAVVEHRLGREDTAQGGVQPVRSSGYPSIGSAASIVVCSLAVAPGAGRNGRFLLFRGGGAYVGVRVAASPVTGELVYSIMRVVCSAYVPALLDRHEFGLFFLGSRRPLRFYRGRASEDVDLVT